MPPCFSVLTILVALVSGVVANYVIFSERYSADPSPIVHDGRVYLYTSHDKNLNHGFDMTDYNCLSSADMASCQCAPISSHC